jgi:predicted negative regulator of RcsB-dependent stress response
MSLLGIPDTADAADAAARVCAWAARLEESGRVDEAKRILLAALDAPGDQSLVTLSLARLEDRAGAPARAAGLLRKVLVDAPGNLAAARFLAGILLAEGKADEAATVVAGVPDSTWELGELAGEICQAQGKHAAAVAAFGRCASLSARGRRLRRRSWWRSGGPFRGGSFRGRSNRDLTPPQVTPDQPQVAEATDVLLEAMTWAEWLGDVGRYDEARQAISEAIAAHGRQPGLLACAASIEEAADAPNTALYLWRESYREAPDDVDISCGLAARLAYTLVKPSYTYRVNDALRVLDGFPDQNHPGTRLTRAYALHGILASASRIVAAYGPADSLPTYSARTRRRLWWRSAGPLGQLRIRVADRIRRDQAASPGTELVVRTESESEAVARVLDSVRGQPPSAVRERIEEAWRQHGRCPSLVLAYADADVADGAYWHRLALAAEAVRSSPGSLDAICSLALAANSTYGYGTALQVMASLPETARKTTEARVNLGDLHRYAGNYALAAAAYGNPRDLNRADRKNRRLCVRRGVLQRFTSTSGGDVEAADLTWFDPLAPAVAQVLDTSASLRDRPVEQRKLVSAALEEHCRHPLLLLELADAERANGDRPACAALAAEAIRSAPADPLIAADGIRKLWEAGFDADALRVLSDLRGEPGDSLALRGTLGDIARYWRLWAGMVEAFGDNGIEAWRWRQRRAAWWRSGGPFSRIRSSLATEANAVISSLPLPAPQEAALSALPLPAPVTAVLRSDLGNYRMALTLRTGYGPRAFSELMKPILITVLTLITFAELTIAEQLRWPSTEIARSLITAAFATVVAEAAFWRLIARGIRLRVALIIFAACGGGAALLLRAPGQWPFGAGLALAAIPLTFLGLCVLVPAVRIVQGIRAARRQRADVEVETGVLSALLDLLGELTVPQLRRGASTRRGWMAALERIAVTVERDLPHALRSGDLDSQREIAAHAQGAAAALRGMKTAVALPDEASWQDLIKQLTGLATALARGDFEHWPPPQPVVTVPRVPRPLWWRVMQAGRTVLLVVGPPLVAFLLPDVAPLTGPGLAWLRFATIVWALLGAIIALDPEIGDRVAKMRQVLGLWRDLTPSKSANSEPGFHGAAGDPQQAMADSAVRPGRADVPHRPTAIRSPRVYPARRNPGARAH